MAGPYVDPRSVRGMVFKPTDLEIITWYLKLKKANMAVFPGTIFDADVYATEPWNHHPSWFVHGDKRNEAFLYTRRHCLGGKSQRANRTVGQHGKWHGSSIDPIHFEKNASEDNTPAGHKSTFNFMHNNKKTDWIMHEYIHHDTQFQDTAICRIYQKTTPTARDNSTATTTIAAAAPYHVHARVDHQRPEAANTVLVEEKVLQVDQKPLIISEMAPVHSGGAEEQETSNSYLQQQQQQNILALPEEEDGYNSFSCYEEVQVENPLVISEMTPVYFSGGDREIQETIRNSYLQHREQQHQQDLELLQEEDGEMWRC